MKKHQFGSHLCSIFLPMFHYHVVVFDSFSFVRLHKIVINTDIHCFSCLCEGKFVLSWEKLYLFYGLCALSSWVVVMTLGGPFIIISVFSRSIWEMISDVTCYEIIHAYVSYRQVECNFVVFAIALTVTVGLWNKDKTKNRIDYWNEIRYTWEHESIGMWGCSPGLRQARLNPEEILSCTLMGRRTGYFNLGALNRFCLGKCVLP